MLTGRTRFRLHSRFLRPSLVVVEVEERVPFNYDPQHDLKPGGYIKRWRDARRTDLETMTKIKEP